MEGGRTEAPTYLGWSIFNTLCCCLPLGIAAIVYSFKAQNANQVGQSAVAMDASQTAKKLNIVALVCGIIMIIIVVAVRLSTQKNPQ